MGNIFKLTIVAGSLISPAVFAAGELEREFAAPPHEAKAWVYWWFQNGYADPTGMVRDVAEMKAKGIGGIQHIQSFDFTRAPLPPGPKMLSPEWEHWFGRMLQVAHEAGLTLSASVCDGWGYGGWWIGAQDAAKQLVYSEAQFDGPGKPPTPLPQPLTRLDLYGDVAVVAFRERNTRRPAPPAAVYCDNVFSDYCREEKHPAAHALDGDPETFWQTRSAQDRWRLKRGADKNNGQESAALELAFAAPLRAAGAYLAATPANALMALIEASEDGKSWRCLERVALPAGASRREAFAPVEASHFRLSLEGADKGGLQVAEFQILRAGDEPLVRRGIKWWEFKSANRGYWDWPPKPYEALEEEYDGVDVCDVMAADVVDLTGRLRPDGRLDWEAPAGRWTILRFGWTPLGQGARSAGTRGLEADPLSARGADLVMQGAAQMRALADKHAGGAPLLFHTDSWEIGADSRGQQPTWTGDFREQFRRLRGYDLLPYLPALARRVVDGRRQTDQFLRDYRDTVADLIALFASRMEERARAVKGAMNSQSGYGTYPHPHMEGLRVFGRCERPQAEMWHPGMKTWALELQSEAAAMRTAASAAHIYGKRFVQAETLTSRFGLFAKPSDYRQTFHAAWARGLNQTVIHKYSHQPLEQKPGLWNLDILNRHFAWWPLADGLLGYVTRCQALLQEGAFVADAAFFVGEGGFRYVPDKACLNPALPAGYDYDGINAEVLLTRASVKDGQLVLPGDLHYRYLVLCEPQCVTMRPATLSRIRQLVQEGVTLVGPPPAHASGLADSEAQLQADVAALWGALPASPRGDRRVGLGRVVWGTALAKALAADGLAPDCEASSDGRPFEISWLHRRSGGGEDIYFLANPLEQALEAAVTLRAKGETVRLFDPLDGSVRELPETRVSADGRTTLPLRFEPAQAFFVVFGKRAAGAQPSAAGGHNFPAFHTVQELAGPWQVSFDTPWVKPLPAGMDSGAPSVTVSFERLTDWTQRPEEGLKAYGGLAVYRKSFDLPSLPGDAAAAGNGLFLSLGAVNEMARVALNGVDLGVSWSPPWRVRLPQGLLRSRGNELVITVANTWNNRIAADSKLPEAQRLTHLYAGFFARPTKPGASSGLLGPVSIQYAESGQMSACQDTK